VAGVGLGDLVPHDLRHTAESLAISAGASVKAVQRMLGILPRRSLSIGTHICSKLPSTASQNRWMLVMVRPRRTSDNVVDLPENSGEADFSGYS
jgi:hypothetical protein